MKATILTIYKGTLNSTNLDKIKYDDDDDDDDEKNIITSKFKHS